VSTPPTGPAQAAHPNPQPAPGQGGSRIGRFLGLLCGLIAYGKGMAERVRQSAGTPTFTLLAKRLGTTDVTAILARIARGLRLAAALHERLTQRAARGRDITHRHCCGCPRPARSQPRPARALSILARKRRRMP
jgi:hypothetical protein